MMELMQNYAKEGIVGIANPDRWEICPAAIEFVSATISASSFEELKKHCFLTETRWCLGDLIGLIWFALISARTFYLYTPRSEAKG
ncbi:hypothetical protein N7539_003234 [Penicillium diatomitis]|uniref:Uncharacterized protein n=1 Tax=Penicillium diatomitis TaxID=2819901 RepID=A0A9X0BZY0_9EURO|nr:uncharacterized protein N7539_003234 [Penicillium diatomitis]KAJ5491667.1 hypothetical protein N7539_003234 [Penicillium diatomitis]